MNDKPQLGAERPISRRTALALIGGVGLGALAVACGGDSGIQASPSAGAATRGGAATSGGAGMSPSCVLTQEATEGPFYLPLNIVRRDITEGKEGVQVRLDLGVVDATTCQPISGAVVDIWHADALGVYSGVVPLGPNSTAPAASGTFLRGIQTTDSKGMATFQTIYPGWYTGRAVHIHVKVHLQNQTVHTGQLFFDDSLTENVYRDNAPYYARPSADTTNESDGIFQQAGAAQAILSMKRQGSGYAGSTTMGVRT